MIVFKKRHEVHAWYRNISKAYYVIYYAAFIYTYSTLHYLNLIARAFNLDASGCKNLRNALAHALRTRAHLLSCRVKFSSRV